METEREIAKIELEIFELKEEIKEKKKRLEELIFLYSGEVEARENGQRTLEEVKTDITVMPKKKKKGKGKA